jgi:hypothetical protein
MVQVQVYKILKEEEGVKSEQWLKMTENARETGRTDPINTYSDQRCQIVNQCFESGFIDFGSRGLMTKN